MEWMKNIILEVDQLRRNSNVPIEFQLALYDLILSFENEFSEKLGYIEGKLREHRAFEVNSTIHMEEIRNIDERLRKLEPILEDRQQTLRSLNEIYEQNKESRSEWKNTIQSLEEKVKKTKEEREKLEEETLNLRSSMEEDRRIAEEEYKRSLDKMKNITKYFPLMHYLLSTTLENIPKAELLIIIGSNQPLINEKIKEKVKSVAPVQILRHLTQLEDDGLIQKSDEGWSLSDNFYQKILNQME